MLILQAQALLKASEIYLKIDNAMQRVQCFRTNIHTLVNNVNNASEVSQSHWLVKFRNKLYCTELCTRTVSNTLVLVSILK